MERRIEDEPLYTCIGKGGKYRLLGEIHGAGSLRGFEGDAYQNIDTGELFVRAPGEFNERMERIK